jgi:TonB-dependent starch-binding outer membrane protein SusC
MRKLIARLTLLLAFLLVLLQGAFSQTRTISGTVTDQSGIGLQGVTVAIRGTNNAVVTDQNGNFSINAASNAVLVFSSVGYGSIEVPVQGRDVVNATLSTQDAALSEVVVIGYGTARRRDITGSVASVNAKDFNKGVLTAPDQLIQGKVAGVQIVNNSGQPGGATTVRIRGASSIRAGTQPLYVIDGVPLAGSSPRPGSDIGFGSSPAANPLNFLNPNDIASMEVLKDASATAIYGSRGANGVIIITTKKGLSGQPSLEFTTSTGFASVMKKLDVLSADEYRAALRQYSLTSGDYGGNVDAFDAITRTGLVQNHNVSISGGNEFARYRFSGGLQDQEGVIRNSDFKKYTGSFNTNFFFLDNKRLGFDVNLLASGIRENIAPISENAGFQGSLVAQALQWNPTHPLRKPNDSIWIDNQMGATTVNPLAMLEAYKDQINMGTVLASISPYFKFIEGLEYRFLYSIERSTGTRGTMLNRFINIQNVEGRGRANLGSGEQTSQQFTNTLNFTRQLTSAFNLNAVIGHEYLKYASRGFGIGAQDFPENIDLNYTNLIQYSTQASRGIGSGESPSSELQSYFARAIMNFLDKYTLTATIRADGSTKFGENNKYGYFPSFAAAWNIANEDFLRGNSFLNTLKLRLSYGEVGNQDFPSGASLNRLVFGQQQIIRTNFGNPDLRWENSKTTNAGIDFGILSDRLFGSFDYFKRRTTDPLYERTVAAPGPSAKVWINLPGEIINEGAEVALNSAIVRSSTVNWNFGVNATFIKNNVTGLGASEFYETGGLHGQGISAATSQRIINNQPLNVFYLARYQSIDKTTGQSLYEGGDPSTNKFYIGSPNPTTLLGISTDVTFQKFTATINMNGAFGHYIYNNTANSVLPIGNLGTRNVARSLVNSDIQEDLTNPIAPSTRYLEKGDYLKLANASIGYRIGNIGNIFKNGFISLTGQNLFVITKFTGFDPEVNTNKAVDGIPSFGIEYTPYPTARTILLGLQFSL